MGWWADSVSDHHYVGPLVICVVGAVVLLIGQVITTRISADILENCAPASLKESAKSIWTNIGVTSALMLTLVAAMLQVDPIGAVGFTIFEEDPGLLIDIQQTYVAAVVTSFLLNLMCMLLCVINMSYVEPLTATDAIKFFFDRPDTLGDPITVLVCAALLMWIALILWVLGTYGMTLAIVSAGVGLVIWICVSMQWIVNGSFNPEALAPGGFKWTQDDPSEWPTSKAKAGTKMVGLRKSKQIQRLVKKLGKAILDEEESLIKGEPNKVW
ncbi:unnamed protein product [Polarella glacialis]|uniref:Uncharacterized protein n=1 Tax=Polarella glacialis TaxID=89957 RepID=A0A813LMX9_POLGL|nr:unnamed protein product [Polarella glacialis]